MKYNTRSDKVQSDRTQATDRTIRLMKINGLRFQGMLSLLTAVISFASETDVHRRNQRLLFIDTVTACA